MVESDLLELLHNHVAAGADGESVLVTAFDLSLSQRSLAYDDADLGRGRIIFLLLHLQGSWLGVKGLIRLANLLFFRYKPKYFFCTGLSVRTIL